MYLKSLELEGFKSFVDTTDIKFTPGFTAIVGPNGCGKSNVSDAIRWVIGEQSSKSLRGNRITDLIFNGSSSRKPVNRTSISLTLTNVPPGLRIANVPNMSEEVKVTRCYHRSGESEFYINQIPCRLKDITDFLLDVGISPKVLTVIEQGHIQDVITSKPENRRILIEEAAGILKFKARKNEAIRKLDASRQNLERVTDIVQELGRQVESLKRQAAKADRYKRYQAEVKDLSLQLFAKKFARFKNDLVQIEEEHSRQSQQKSDWTTRASTLDNDIERLGLEMEESFKNLHEKREKAHALTGRIGNDEHSIELKQEQVARAETDIAAATEEISRMKEEIESFAKEMEESRRQLEQAGEDISLQEEGLERETGQLNQHKESLQDLEEKVRAGDQRILELYHEISRKRNELTALETRKQFLETRNDKLKEEEAETLSQIEAIRRAVADAESDHEEKLGRVMSLTEQRETLAEQTSQCKESLNHLSEELAALKENYLSRSSLITSLKELRTKFEGFQEGVQSLMNYNANGGRMEGLRAVLADVLKTPKEYECAIETVLGDKLQSIIVNSYSDSIEAIGYLKDHRSGRGSFIPMHPKALHMPPVQLNGNTGVLGKAVDFIECEEEYRPIINHLLGNVVLVQDLETAVHLQENPEFQGTVVTLNGEMIDLQGLVTGGTAKEGDDGGLLAQNREIEEMTVEAAGFQEEMKLSIENVEQKDAELCELETNMREVHQSLHESEIVKAGSRKDLEQFQKDLERLEQKRLTIEYERSSGNHELEELSRTWQSLDGEIASAEENKTREEEALAGLRSGLDECREALERKVSEISQIQVMLASLKGRRENIIGEIKRLEMHQENLLRHIQRREEDKLGNVQKISDTRQEIEILENQILEKVREKDLLKEEIVADEDCLRQKEEHLKEMEQETRELSKKIQELTEAISKIEVRKSETKIQMAHIEERAYEDYNATVREMMSNYSEDINEEEVDGQIHELKGKIQRMGEVNLAALSEFQQTNERYEFLKQQQEDLAESIQLLHETIEKINRTTQSRFKETFEKVNENFKEIFARLFRGGKAELRLTDESNVLDAGVEISANPLGKRMQNLTLLSGGEKSLTAIALMFAVFKVRPSPFCLLDEVDAPLDEANVVRFQEMLKEMSDETQFIIITHNQKTMSFADVLYGITMEEEGVSKAVSVHLN
ncbi:MAG: chromosome segregation protein SMC [Nitrospinaceae bacterium]